MANIPIKKRPAYAQSPGTRLARPAAGGSPMRGQQASSIAQVDPSAFTAQAVAQSRRALAAGERAEELGSIGGYLTDLSLHLSDMRNSRMLMEIDNQADRIRMEAEVARKSKLDPQEWGPILQDTENRLKAIPTEDMPREVRDKAQLNLTKTIQEMQYRWELDRLDIEPKLYEQEAKNRMEAWIRYGQKSKAHEILDQTADKLGWSENYKREMRGWVNEFSDHVVIDEAMLGNPAKLNEDLKARDKDGNPKYFKSLDADKRLAATRSSATEMHRFQTANLGRMLAELDNGTYTYTDDELDKMVENKQLEHFQAIDYKNKRNKWQPQVKEIMQGYDMAAAVGAMDRSNEEEFLAAHKQAYSFVSSLPAPYSTSLKGKLEDVLDPQKHVKSNNLNWALGKLMEAYDLQEFGKYGTEVAENTYISLYDQMHEKYYAEDATPTMTRTKEILRDVMGGAGEAKRTELLKTVPPGTRTLSERPIIPDISRPNMPIRPGIPMEEKFNPFPTKHPMVTNEDGTVSNVRLMTVSFSDPGGAESHVVIPTMVEGKLLSMDEAVKVARKHGIHRYPAFKTAKEAEEWIEKNHANISEPEPISSPDRDDALLESIKRKHGFEGGNFPLHREKAPLPTMEPERWPGVSRYFSREEVQSKRSGEEKVDRDMIRKADRMRELFGGPVRISSGYRDYVPKGGAKNSQHMHGRALDINMASWSHARRAKLLQAALDAGFTGIGFYKDSPNMLHVDTGPKRSWEWGLSDFPAWARNIMASHGYTPDSREQ